MNKVITNAPSDELLMKIQCARECIRNKTRREIRCPYCKRIACIVYADSTGYIETKCEKCKQTIIIDLINMRKLKK